MAALERLSITRLRNLAAVDAAFPASGAVFVGVNGAGKTTLLEAVYLLSRGRSFRGKRFGPLVAHGADASQVEGVIWREGHSDKVSWSSVNGLMWRACHGGGPYLPVRLICNATHTLAEGDPAVRRRFLDWNLVQTEPGYHRLWGDFRRVAMQRNAWLRSGGVGAAVWDEPYAKLAAEIDLRRERLVSRLSQHLCSIGPNLPGCAGLRLEWAGGKPEVGALLIDLRRMRMTDVTRGYTWCGPSRADFRFCRDGRRWLGSRGETKIAGLVLQVAADAVSREATGVCAIWLIDDIAAELGRDSVIGAVRLLQSEQRQLLFTALPETLLLTHARAGLPVFHVEHGDLTT